MPGGDGTSHRAGDLVLSPGRSAQVQAWLSPVLAHVAVRFDEAPGRHPRDLRVAMPVPARDGAWVVEGWSACRYEPGTEVCRDPDVTLAAGRVLHAQLAASIRRRPPGLAGRGGAMLRAERLAFGPANAMLKEAVGTPAAAVVRRAERHLVETDLGPSQLVHGDLAGNVLLDLRGAPVVVDVVPFWRPIVWAEALAVLDLVVRYGAPLASLAGWTSGERHQAILRALLFRAFADEPLRPELYRRSLDVIAPE
ncbi:MAG: aminoglycoside phosphotransferase [Nocardioides sp.]|nr:aminoglycoside phosphotransferase [Nocardioides sp.]